MKLIVESDRIFAANPDAQGGEGVMINSIMTQFGFKNLEVVNNVQLTR